MKRDTKQTKNNETNEKTRVFRLFRYFSFVSCLSSFYSKQRLSVFNRLTVLDEDLGDCAARFRRNLIHQFHCFNYAKDLAALNLIAKVNKRIGIRRWRPVKCADNR